MDVSPSFSNSASKPGDGPLATGAMLLSLASLDTALATLAGALRAYSQEAGGAGQRALGARWTAALRELAEVEGLLALQAPPTAQFESLAAAADASESALLRLESAAGAILDPNVEHAAAAGMSRTYSDSVKALLRAAKSAGARAREAWRSALAAAAGAGATTADPSVAGAYAGSGGRGGIATELYVSALVCLGSRLPAAASLLEAAKDTALGGAADSRAAAGADSERLAGYHPCQAMDYTPAFSGGDAPPGPAPDLRFPQARLAVTYDLGPLVDRRRALQYGPVASTLQGLSYRLLERLRTIRAEPAAPLPAAAAAAADTLPAIATGPIAVVAGDGARRAFGPEGAWAPLGGARPRVAAYAGASAAVILGHVRADGWGGLRSQYEAAVENRELPSGETAAAVLVDALVAAFERAYDTAPPSSAQDFRGLVVPEAPAPGDYISAAAARVSGQALSARLRAVLAQHSPRVPYAVVEREGRLSQAVLALDIARALWRRLREVYWADEGAFAQPPVRRKAMLLHHFRRLASAAAAAAPIYCAPPSLKLWAAERH